VFWNECLDSVGTRDRLSLQAELAAAYYRDSGLVQDLLCDIGRLGRRRIIYRPSPLKLLSAVNRIIMRASMAVAAGSLDHCMALGSNRNRNTLDGAPGNLQDFHALSKSKTIWLSGVPMSRG
jgi:hypothetical protein